jgi:hypothetical protein
LKDFLHRASLETKLRELEAALTDNDVPLIRSLLKLLVAGYQPESVVSDRVHIQRHVKVQEFHSDDFYIKFTKTS